MATYDQCCKAMRKHQRSLRRFPNVKGVVVAKKITGGRESLDWSVTVFVEIKEPTLSAVPTTLRIGMTKVPTDVIETGVIEAYDAGDRKLWHPTVDGGISMGHRAITAGTLGGFVRHRSRPETMALTNNHVGAATNIGVRGHRWYNPGLSDQDIPPGGDPPLATAFAQLYDYERIEFKGQLTGCSSARVITKILNWGVKLVNLLVWWPINTVFALFGGSGYWATPSDTLFVAQDADPINYIDAAIGTLDREDKFTNRILDASNEPTIKVPGTVKFKIGDLVAKSGRTTEWTDWGIVFAVDGIVDIQYGPGQIALFENQIFVRNVEGNLRPFSAGGDSGSWVLLNDSPYPVGGLLFAGGQNLTIANHIHEVFTRLKITGVA